MKNLIKNGYSQRGISLVETMAALAVTGIVLVASSQVVSYVNKQVQKSVTLSDQTQLQSIIEEKTAFADFCSAALGPGSFANSGAGNNPNPVVLLPTDNSWQLNNAGKEVQLFIPGIKSGAAMTLNTISANSANGDNILPLLGVKIYSLKIQNGYQVPGATVPAGETQYIAKLVAQMGALPNGNASTSNSVAQLPPPVVLDTLTLDIDTATGKVLDCRGGVTQSTGEVCQSFGCTYDASQNPPCQCPPYQRGCADPFQIPVGVDKNGLIICQYPANVTCGNNTYLSGIKGSQGICTTYQPNNVTVYQTSCPALSNWTWSANGNNCAGTLAQPSSPMGTTTAPINNVVANLTGSATFICSNSGVWQVASSACSSSAPPPPGACPIASMQWNDPTTGDGPCIGSTNSTSAGSNFTVSNTSQLPYLTGSATYACQASGSWAAAPTSPTCTCSSGWGFEAKINCCKGCGIDTAWMNGYPTKAACQQARKNGGPQGCGSLTPCLCSP